MNNLEKLFQRKSKNLLSVYFTAGYPTFESTGEIIKTLAAHGADMIEIGVPFSDPMADGVVIQQSSTEALRNGMSLKHLLDQVNEVRNCCDIPLILMGYLNPMYQYGIEKLFSRCAEIGIDGMIIPDLPFNEYMANYKTLCEKYNIPLIMLITPETSEERIRLIDQNCGGFIYMVSSASTTGVKDHFTEEQIDYFNTINNMSLSNKRLIGFGISNAKTLNTAQQYSSGAIIGSLFIKCLGRQKNIPDAVDDLMQTLKK